MTESSSGIEPDRLAEISIAARKAKEEGLSQRNRREAVIVETGQQSLDEESVEVRERAINKYWNLEMGSPDVPVLIVAPHAQKINEEAVLGLLRDKFPGHTYEELLELSGKWFEAKKKQETDELVNSDGFSNEIVMAINRLANRIDSSTGGLARALAKKGSTALALPKKSRMWADANRMSFFHKPRGVGQQEGFIQTREYPTSIRASWYWVTQRAIESTVGLDDSREAVKPFLQIVVHGMKDRRSEDGGEGYDVVIGGGDIKKGEEGRLADDKVSNWLAEALVRKVNEQKESSDDFKVAIDKMEKETVEVFQAKGGKVEKKEIKKIGKGLSGAGLGLEYFRTGCDFEAENLKGKRRVLKFPGFGVNFNTIQLEVSRNIRENPAFRAAVAQTLGELSIEFGERFD